MPTTEPALDKLEAIIQGFFALLPNLGIALVVFLLFLAGAWGARRGVMRVAVSRGNRDLGVLLSSFVRWSVLLIGLLVVATIVFPSIKPADLLSTLGIGTVAIGFAFKDILQNWLSGLLILYRQPFRTGDQIRSGEFEGTVERVEARATHIRTYDGQRVVVPNSDIYTRAVIVKTAFPVRRSEYDVGIGYGDGTDRAIEVILRAVRVVEGVVDDPPPEAFAWELSGSSVNVRVWWWSQSRQADAVAARGKVIAAVKTALTDAGIDLPFPTRMVLLHDQTEETDGDRARQREGWPKGHQPPKPRHLNEVRVDGSGSDRSNGR